MAPLTLLVGENSTGKTSLLALIRALWQLAFRDEIPDFREEPYDLGTFADVVHNRGGRGKLPASFQAGFGVAKLSTRRNAQDTIEFRASFEERGAFPFPVRRRVGREGSWVEVAENSEGHSVVSFRDIEESIFEEFVAEFVKPPLGDNELIPLEEMMKRTIRGKEWEYLVGSFPTDWDSIVQNKFVKVSEIYGSLLSSPLRHGPFASAPVRSQPRRTYDPSRYWQDPEGANVPTYLASLFYSDQAAWKLLKESIEEFGRESGLFDEILVKSFGRTEATPFQLQVRKYSGKLKGPPRNIIDVGYGVSQVLPVVVEALDPASGNLFLLQQPEVHLHPKAQAALGGLFCSIAATGRQVIVETHSDYLLDRVRMDIRDKKTALKPEDVSILYFEPGELEVKIHSLRLDELGNVLDAPPGYGQFFMDEVRRSIGL